MKKVFKTLAIAAAAALCFCSCDDTEKIYTGNEAPVYFGENEAVILISENDSHVDLTVRRLSDGTALTIGINVLEKSDELQIPASIKFEAGQSETTVSISFPANTQPGTSYSFDIELQGADPFLQAGNANFSAIIANPERIQARTTPYYTIDQIGEWYTEVLKISDKLWILPNFWNSGVDVTLTGTEVVGDGDILLDISANKGYHDVYDDNGDLFDEWWLYDEGNDPIILYPHGKDADLQMEGGFFYNSTNKPDGNFSFYKPSTKRIELEFDFEMFRQATGWVYDVTNFEFFSLRMGESALADFEPYLPEYKAPGASVPVKAYLKSAPETVYNWTGYWDPEDEYSFVMDKGESQFNYYNTVTFTLDKNTLAISNISGAAVSYSATDGYYSFNDYFYLGGKYNYGWIYDGADTYYDYDKNTFSFIFGYGDIDDANDYHDDVLILELQEN